MIALFFILLINLFNQKTEPPRKVTFSSFVSAVEENKVRDVVIQGPKIAGNFTDNKEFVTYAPADANYINDLRKHNVEITAEPIPEEPLWKAIFINWFPMLLLIGIWIFFMRQMQSGGGKAMSFGKSRAKLLSDGSTKVTFKDVAGVEESKAELEEIVDFLRDPKKFTRLGGRIPKGVLLVGSPGTGKTLLAKAIAGEAGVPFFSISGSDFVEMFVGVGASRVRDLFMQGKKNAPCIIFIDEIDAVGRHRGAGLGGGHDEREQTLNQLLVEMDGFETNEGVILIAATNRPDVLDPALLRPGRFDRQVVVPRPDLKGRHEILKVHTRKLPLDSDVNLEVIARGTPGMSGADLESVANEAALLAGRANKNKVSMLDFEMAKDKVMLGVERKSVVMSEVERRNTAVHEAGHAVVGKIVPGNDPVHKITIIPRGMALGITHTLPVEDAYSLWKDQAEGKIAMLLGGRVAEEVVFGRITTGAGNDIERATELARKMVCEWGMSEKLGPLSFGKREEQIFLGRELQQHKDYSEETARQIDSEVRRFVMEGYEKAHKILAENRQKLDDVSAALLERETLTGEEFDALMEGRKLEPKPLETKTPPRPPAEKPERAGDGGSGIILPGRSEFPSKA
jgi:cell division protease FtsH